MKEKLMHWIPIKGLPKEFYIDTINAEGDRVLNILLTDEADNKNKVQLIFQNSLESYKFSTETASIKSFHRFIEKYGREFVYATRFLIIDNSDYITSVVDESCGLIQSKDLKHFCIVGTDSVIHIIASSEPKVTILE